MIDVSYASIQMGVVYKVCEAVKNLLYGQPSRECMLGGRGLAQGTKIGIVTFDRAVQFYNLNVFSYFLHFTL